MRQFTTPTLKITVYKKVGIDEHGQPILEPASDLVFDYILFSLKAMGKRLDKTVPFSEYSEGVFKVRYSQEETGNLHGETEAEINFMRGETRIATCIRTINIDKNLVNEVISNG